MASQFVHLHAHSEFSLLDGANRTRDMIRRAKEFEQPALALTDHGTMSGAWVFHKEARKEGVRPIIGMEAYVAPGSRHDRGRVDGEKGYYHLVMLARDREGYKNLSRLSSIGYTEGFYMKPRIDREVIAKHSEGIIVTSACLAGEVAQHLMADRWDDARAAASWYAELFQGRYYLEVQAHDSSGQADLNAKIFRLAEELGIPVVATNDAHFLTADDHQAHDVLMCIGLGRELEDPSRMRYDRELYFKNVEEMASRFPDRPDVLENTLDIADQVDVSFDKKYHVPAFPLPAGIKTEDELLRTVSFDGARVVYADQIGADGALPAEVLGRLEYEIKVITDLGYSGYFLILQDVINWCRQNKIPVGPGRGSAAGSIVAYTLGITEICPLKYDLLFERFLNPERATMPDIDTDFAQEGRQEVIQYVRDRFGDDAVCQIITFGTLGTKGVLTDVGRTLGFPAGEIKALTKKIPNELSLAEAVEQIPELKQMSDSLRTRERDLIRFSLALEGLSRHASIHAGGVVIAPGPVEEYVPIATQKSGERRVKVTQYDMNAVEEAGLLKFDFLGLKTLDQIDYALEMVRQRHGRALVFDLRGERAARESFGPDFEIQMVSVEDPSIYELLRAGRTCGIFQLESALATDKIRAMRADRFEDIVATNALIRPGPLETGMTERFIRRKRYLQTRGAEGEPVAYPHPDLEDVLEPTLGVIVYQEQVMRTAQKLAGFSLAEADILRKAVGKKDAELIHQELTKFVDRAVASGHDRAVIQNLADQIEAFGRYGFNKSHSAAYSLLSAQSAYIKANYPAEFLAAVLSFEPNDKIPVYLAEARDLGIPVLPASVNESATRFSVVDLPSGGGAIRFGFGGIKNVGNVGAAIIAERERNGAFADFFDFVARCYAFGLNARSLQALIDAGACDEFGHRAQLLHAVDQAIAHAQAARKEQEMGQETLFDALFGGGVDDAPVRGLTLPVVPPMPPALALEKEKELMGFYISGHPMDDHEADAALVRSRRLHVAEAVNSGGLVTLVGMVTAVDTFIAKRSGNPWGRAVIEDMTGAQVIKAFGRTWERYGHKLEEGAVVVVRGRYQDDDPTNEQPDFIVEDIDPLEVAVALARKRGAQSPSGNQQGEGAMRPPWEPEPDFGMPYEYSADFEEIGGPHGAWPEIEARSDHVSYPEHRSLADESLRGTQSAGCLRLRVPRPLRPGDPLADRILRALKDAPGEVPVQFCVAGTGEFRTARSTVSIEDSLLAELKAILGEDDVFLHTASPPER